MDELIIGEKTYISSKRAAKITGYAKDYVGQLCREGRVEARLVGRNWYVLESSIREHRFGLPAEESEVAPVEEPKEKEDVTAIAWSSPIYEVEETAAVPALLPKDPQVLEARKVVSEMQDAWKEWFTTQKAAELQLSDGEQDFDGTLTPAILPEEPAPQEVVNISRIVHQDTVEPVYEQYTPEPEEETLPIHKTYDNRYPVSNASAAFPVMDLSPRQVPKARVRNTPELVTVSNAVGKSSLLIKSLLISIALVSACVALIGTGTVTNWTTSNGASGEEQSPLIKMISGESEYKSIK